MNKLVKSAKLLAKILNYNYSDAYINRDTYIFISYGQSDNPRVMTDNEQTNNSFIYLGRFNDFKVYCSRFNSDEKIKELKIGIKSANLKLIQNELNELKGKSEIRDEWAELELEGIFEKEDENA